MGKERIGVAIVSDKEKVGLREKLQVEIEKNPNLNVSLLSRVKASRIRQEIKKKNPDMVFITASLYTPEEVNEVCGFVKKLRKHLPQTNIVIHTPQLSTTQREAIFAAGADWWIDDNLAYETLTGALEKMVTGEEIVSLSIIRKRGLTGFYSF